MQTKTKLKEKTICGIDEAGRGPVIGPLIVAGVSIPEYLEKQLKQLGVRDSKLITPKKREAIAKEIKKNSSFTILTTYPAEIDTGDNKGLNLNQLEAAKAAQIITELAPNKVIIDCPSTNKKEWNEQVQNLLPQKLKKETEIIVEHKADAKHPIVGAASILAKTTRDKEIAKIQKKIPEPIGSGYPSDPITKQFLKNNWKNQDHEKIIRKSWQTFKNLANPEQKQQQKTKQKSLKDF